MFQRLDSDGDFDPTCVDVISTMDRETITEASGASSISGARMWLAIASLKYYINETVQTEFWNKEKGRAKETKNFPQTRCGKNNL